MHMHSHGGVKQRLSLESVDIWGEEEEQTRGREQSTGSQGACVLLSPVAMLPHNVAMCGYLN